ncbi:MAG: ComF family protein [Gammaproteobacteria bacterium]
MRYVPNPPGTCQPLSALQVDGLLSLGRRLEAWLLPPRCVLCLEPGSTVATPGGGPGVAGALLDLCPACHAELPWRLAPVRQDGNVPPGITLAYAPLRYAWPVAPLIHAFKYRGERTYGRLLGTVMAAAAARHRLPLPEVWIPVPLHPQRQAHRGFNQSGDLAGRLRRDTGIGVAPALRRLRQTAAQAGLTAIERRANLQGAFALDERWRRQVVHRHVALVDDVCTTGSTAAACAAALRAAGARRIDLWTIARA